MKIILLTSLFLLFTSFHVTAQELWDSNAIRIVLEDRMEKEKRATAMVVGVLDQSGPRVIACGKPAKDSALNASGETVFEIGSISKVFTSLLLADMVQKGEVKLEDPISKYLPASVKAPTRNGKEIRLVDLATHTSGLPRLPDNLEPADGKDPYADYSADRLYAFLTGCKLKRDIGSKYEYSNLGAGLLGHILELRAGTNYNALLQERICKPLGLADTAIVISPVMKEHLATGHNASGRTVPSWNFIALAGAGGVRSSINDLLKLGAACLGLQQTSLSKAIALTLMPRVGTDSSDTRIGLAWHMTSRHGTEIKWHNGETGGYHAYIGLDQAKKRAVAILVNAGTSIDDLGQHILNPDYPLKKIKSREVRAEVTLDSQTLDRCVGQYQLTPKYFFNVRRAGNHLEAQLTGQSYLDLYPSSATEFFYDDVKAEITFGTNTAGRVTALTLHQNGLDQTARKIE